ncbi:MAG: hypothetical protein Tsb002_32670 [Wenzhouxiangellaceae bacterium]
MYAAVVAPFEHLMVSLDSTTSPACVTVLAQANLSISAERLLTIFIALSLVALAIAGGLTLLGYWPVLLFALIHQSVVGWALWYAWRSHWIREWIVVGANGARVVRIDHRGRHEWHHDNDWLRIVRAGEPARHSRNPRLYLRSSSGQTEIGAFLTDTERDQLARALHESLAAWQQESATERANDR